MQQKQAIDYNRQNKYYHCKKETQMIQNPQIKFDGLPNKGYLFPKYQGKFFIVKTQKIKQNKSNHLMSSSPKPIKNLFYQHFHQQNYKEIKVQAQYMKKMKQLKKKLQREICKYSKDQNDNFKLTNKLNMTLIKGQHKITNSPQPKSFRMFHDLSDFGGQEDVLMRKQEQKSQLKKLKRKYAFRLHAKNNSQIKRRIKTDINQLSESQRSNVAPETQFFTNRSTNSIKSKQSSHLPLIPKKQISLQSKHSFSISSSIRYSLPSRVFKSQTKKKLQIQEEQLSPSSYKSKQSQVRFSTEVMNKQQQYDSINEKLKMRAMGIGLKRKNNDYRNRKKQTNPRQTFLNGWEFSNDRQSNQINYLQ